MREEAGQGKIGLSAGIRLRLVHIGQSETQDRHPTPNSVSTLKQRSKASAILVESFPLAMLTHGSAVSCQCRSIGKNGLVGEAKQYHSQSSFLDPFPKLFTRALYSSDRKSTRLNSSHH